MTDIKFKIRKKILYKSGLHFIWILSVILFFFVPLRVDYSLSVFMLLMILYAISLICFFKIKKKINYFDFDTIFIAFCSIEHFLSGFYVNAEEFSRLITIDVDTRLIIKGTLLSMVGIISYMEGAIHLSTIKYAKNKGVKSKDRCKISVVPIFLIYVALYIVYLYAGGLDFYKAQYMEGVGSLDVGGLAFQTQALFVTFARVFIVIIFLHYLSKGYFIRRDVICALIILATTIPITIVGNRTVFSFILVPFLMCYCKYCYPLSIKKTAVLSLCGVLVMFAIQRLRNGNTNMELDSIVFLFSDIISPGKMMLVCLDYVDKFGINYGMTMLPPIIGIIPGLSSYLGSWTTVGSAEALTRYAAPIGFEGGMGTTIIADVFISFGFVGVILLMYALGLFVNYDWKNQTSNMIKNVALFSTCIFMGRSSCLLFLRPMIWMFVIYFIFNMSSNNGKKCSILPG